MGDISHQYLMVVVSDAIESELSAAAKAAQLLHRRVETELLLALEFAVVTGYEVTMVKAATADYSDREMQGRARSQHP